MCLTKKKCRRYGSKDFMNLKNNNYANKENSAIWASNLRARDLVVNSGVKGSLEAYNPFFSVSQLGFVQLIPLPPIFTGNVPWHERATVKMDEINVLNSKDEAQTESFKLKLFWRWSESSKPFEEWWDIYLSYFNTPEALQGLLDTWPKCLRIISGIFSLMLSEIIYL